MSEKPISDLRHRMLEDIASRSKITALRGQIATRP
jgi:hypothetical protein